MLFEVGQAFDKASRGRTRNEEEEEEEDGEEFDSVVSYHDLGIGGGEEEREMGGRLPEAGTFSTW